MGRWVPEEHGKITRDTSAFLGRANNDEEARALCSIHNADCDAYEATIVELTFDRDSETRWACQYKEERDTATATLERLRDAIRRQHAELFYVTAAQELRIGFDAKPETTNDNR